MVPDLFGKQILKRPVGSGTVKVPELLSPAGGPESARAAILSGADAVYLGLKEGSARAGAENFTLKELGELCGFAHMRNVRVYVALNTLPFGGAEADRYLSIAQKTAQEGADGIIVQDTGLLASLSAMRNKGLLRPDFRVHVSTQAGIANADGLDTVKELGADRVILPRELTLSEIKALANYSASGPGIELEIFVHGAMCMCYSGSCLLSSYIGGRSGNRGSCAQPCRLKYAVLNENGSAAGDLPNPLSPDDLCTLGITDLIASSGVASVKIEGRLKSPEYTALTTRIYREALDAVAEDRFGKFIENDMNGYLISLRSMFTRAGGAAGFLLGNRGRDHITGNNPGRSGAFIGIAKNVRPAASRSSGSRRLDFFSFRFIPDAAVSKKLPAGDGVTLLCADGTVLGGGTVNKIDPDGSVLVCGELAPARPGGKAVDDIDANVYLTKDSAVAKQIEEALRPGSEPVKVPVELSFEASSGTPASLTVSDSSDPSLSVTVLSDDPAKEARNAPLTEESVRKQLSKLSGTCFWANAVSVRLCGSLFMTVGELNALRRKAIDAYVSAKAAAGEAESHSAKPDISAAYDFTRSSVTSPRPVKAKLRALKDAAGTVRSRFYFSEDGYLDENTPDAKKNQIVYLPWTVWLDREKREAAMAKARMNKDLLIASLPFLPFDTFREPLCEILPVIMETADGIQLTNLGDFALLKSAGASGSIICADCSPGASNPLCANELAAMGADVVTLSPEYPDCSIAGSLPSGVFAEIIEKGSVPLMRTRHCVIGHGLENCSKCSGGTRSFYLSDNSGGKYDIIPLPDNTFARRSSAGLKYGRRFCENVILSPDNFSPKAAKTALAALPFPPEKAQGGNIILRTQIVPGGTKQ